MKISEEQQQKGQELVQSLISKSWEDPAFKTALIANPASTISNLTGKDLSLPANTSIVVEDQTDENIVYLNIPAEPSLDSLELNEEQLTLVAGGATPASVVIVFYCITAMGAGVAIGKAL